MDEFLDIYDLPKLTKEDMTHLTRCVTSNEIETVIKSLTTKESPELD
jgi:hypothetical protein